MALLKKEACLHPGGQIVNAKILYLMRLQPMFFSMKKARAWRHGPVIRLMREKSGDGMTHDLPFIQIDDIFRNVSRKVSNAFKVPRNGEVIEQLID